jgi:HicB family
MVGASGIAQETVSSYRISLRRSGDDDALWRAEVEDHPEWSVEGTSPEEALQRAWAAANGEPKSGRKASGSATHSGRLLVRMPASLHDELARTAETEGVSLNQLITSALASAVGWRGEGRKAEGRAVDGAAVLPVTEGARWPQPRVTRIVLAANFALVLVAAIAAIALLVVAWNGV